MEIKILQLHKYMNHWLKLCYIDSHKQFILSAYYYLFHCYLYLMTLILLMYLQVQNQ